MACSIVAVLGRRNVLVAVATAVEIACLVAETGGGGGGVETAAVDLLIYIIFNIYYFKYLTRQKQ